MSPTRWQRSALEARLPAATGAGATDLVVIGGGPAGLATAIQARLAGLSVRVLERSRPPIDKACGEGLMPDAALRLAELGVELPAEKCCRLRGIRYLDGEVVAEGLFPRAPGLGVRRLHLHQALAARAAELGVELCWGLTATGLAPAAASPHSEPPALSSAAPALAGRDAGPQSRETGGVFQGVLTDGGLVEARWIVGADGLNSHVRRWAGLEAPSARLRRFGVRRHFACRPWSDLVEVYWGPGCEAYVTPVGPEEVGVAMLWGGGRAVVGGQAAADGGAGGKAGRRGSERGRGDGEAGSNAGSGSGEGGKVEGDNEAGGRARPGFDALLASFPALAERLAGTPVTSRDRGAGPLLQRTRAVHRGNVALVGDAAGYVDAITGEGLAVALHQSAALVEALAGPPSGDLCRYAAAHRRLVRLPATMTALVLALERRPWLRRRAVRALAAEPALFSRLLAIHARALAPRQLGVEGALRLVYRLVVA